MSSRYITVTHNKGATYGYGGPYQPVTHRFLWTGTGAYGAQSLTKLFHSEQEMIEHFKMFTSKPTGQFGDFSWFSEVTNDK